MYHVSLLSLLRTRGGTLGSHGTLGSGGGGGATVTGTGSGLC